MGRWGGFRTSVDARLELGSLTSNSGRGEVRTEVLARPRYRFGLDVDTSSMQVWLCLSKVV